MNKLLTGVSAAALVAAFGTGTALANPTVKNVEDISTGGECWESCGNGGGDIEIGTVEIEVELEQEIESVEGGSADGGEGGEWNYAGGAGTNKAGNGGKGGYGGDAKAKNDAYISIENHNVAVLSENNMEAENELSFSVFIQTGDNDGSFEGGSAEGGEGGEAEVEASGSGEIEAEAEVGDEENGGGPGNATAYAGNATGGAGGYAKGGNGGYIKTGNVYFTTGDVTYNDNVFQHAAGQFNVAANTGIANINQQGNSVAAHVPVGVTVNNAAKGGTD